MNYKLAITIDGHVNRKEIKYLAAEYYEFSPDFFQKLHYWGLLETLLDNFDQIDVNFLQERFQGRCQFKGYLAAKTICFHLNNPYDLEKITITPENNGHRIIVSFINSPIRDFYLFKVGNYLQVDVSLSSKSYFIHSSNDVRDFFNYLDDQVEFMRDVKINSLTTQVSPNLIRQFKWKISQGGGWDNLFGNIWKYYLEHENLSPRQIAYVEKGLLWN